MAPRKYKRKNKRKGKKKTFKKKRTSAYPSIKNGLTLEHNSINATQILTTALTDPYSNPSYQSFTTIHRVSDCAGLAQIMLQQYEWYRIAGVEMTITNKNNQTVTSIPFNAPGTAAGTGLYQTTMGTEFIILPNRDGTTYPTGITSSIWQEAKQHRRSIWIKNIKGESSRKVRCKPNTLTMGYEGAANTGYYQKYDAWTRNNDFGTPFYSWTIFIKAQTTIREHYAITFKYLIQYKSKQGKDYNSILEFGQRLTHPMGSVIDAQTDEDSIFVEKTDDDLVLIYPNHDPATDVPNMNGYDSLDITTT